MIFRLVTKDNELQEIEDTFQINDLPLESLLCLNPGEELPYGVFGENLLFLDHQIVLGNKRFEMLALDKLGRCVVIELKRENAYYSTNMQALDSLAVLRTFKGEQFLNLVCKKSRHLKQAIESYFPNTAKLNESSRIILVARSFDDGVFSVGRWMSEKDIPFKCIQFRPVLIGQEKFISFSIVFNQSNIDEYAESLVTGMSRAPQKYWHILNYGKVNNDWWHFCREKNIIALNYDNIESDSCPGYRKMNEYIVGDEVFIWAKGHGVVGYGKVTGQYKYQPHPIHTLPGHKHTRQVRWEVTIPLENAISALELKKLQISNPRHSKQTILHGRENLQKLVKMLCDKMQEKQS